MPIKILLVLTFCLLNTLACSDDAPMGGEGLCSSTSAPTAILGQGVGGAFLPYEDMQEVGLAVAPQGGFGVTVIVRTQGLSAGSGSLVNIQLNVEESGRLSGEYLQEGTALSCRGSDIGGEVRGVVVGFDPQVYKSNDDLIALDGRIVDLVVTVTDSEGGQAMVRKSVKIRIGN